METAMAVYWSAGEGYDTVYAAAVTHSSLYRW